MVTQYCTTNISLNDMGSPQILISSHFISFPDSFFLMEAITLLIHAFQISHLCHLYSSKRCLKLFRIKGALKSQSTDTILLPKILKARTHLCDPVRNADRTQHASCVSWRQDSSLPLAHLMFLPWNVAIESKERPCLTIIFWKVRTNF